MKKQLLAAAVAATMTSVAMADVSITGNAKFEYKATETDASISADTTNTEVNLGIKGKTGDTTVVANIELNTHGSDSSGAIDVEDLYMTTKVGDVNVKAGNFASGTTALLGEIDEGGRATNKVSLTANVGAATVGYHVAGASTGTGATELDSQAAAVTVSMPIAGWKVQVKEQSDSYTGIGVAGSIAGVDVRLEQKNSDTANNDVTFGNVTTDVNGVTLGYAWVDADAVNLITESDSGVFGVSANDTASNTTNAVDGMKQFTAKTNVAGNTVTLRAGTIEEGSTDNDFTRIDVARSLASGATLTVTYTDKDDFSASGAADTTTSEIFEVDLSVKF